MWNSFEETKSKIVEREKYGKVSKPCGQSLTKKQGNPRERALAKPAIQNLQK